MIALKETMRVKDLLETLKKTVKLRRKPLIVPYSSIDNNIGFDIVLLKSIANCLHKTKVDFINTNITDSHIEITSPNHTFKISINLHNL